MADETLNIGPDEVNAAEPEVTEQPAGDSPPEAAAPEPEQAETTEPGMEESSAGESPGEGHEPDAPGDTPPQEVAGAVVEDAPAQEPLPGDGPAVEPLTAEEPEAPAPGEDGEVVVSFDKISELIATRNQEARAAIEQEDAATPQPDGMDKGPEEPAQEEPAPKRRGRPPKEKKPEHKEKTEKPRRGRKPKEAAQDKDTSAGKPRDKMSQGKRGKTAPEQETPGGGAAAGAPAVEGDTPAADVEAAFGLKDATRAAKEEVVYLVTVSDTDTKNPVAGATVTLHADEPLSIRLPSGRLLDYDDQTTIRVQLVKDKSPVVGMGIAVTDRNDNYSSGKTDSAGQLTVPCGSDSTNEDGKGTVGWEDADGDRHTLTVKVEDFETKRPIPDAGISIGKTGTITVTLPDGEDMDGDNRITVTVTDQERQPQEGLSVIVKGDLGQTERGETDENGQLTVPEVAELETHGAYVVGYTDGTFGPGRSMRRSEAATIFARLLSQRLGERITAPTTATFPDVPADAWYAGYVSYLTRYGVAVGYTDGLFHGDEPISRAEFTAMAVRFFDAYGDGDQEIMEDYQDFWDVSPGHWAAGYIEDAARHGWVVGYGDGTFQPEDEISRAEVVTIVNRLLGREADQDYIASGPRGLVRFPDVPSSHWAYYDILEASNYHEADVSSDPEVWQEK